MQDNFNIHNWRLKVAINELEENEASAVYTDWDEYVNPDYILVILKNGRKLKIEKKRIKGGQRVYQAILQAFNDNNHQITDKIVTTMVNQLDGSINELEEKTLCKECGSGYMEEGMCNECGYMEEGASGTTDFNKKAEDFINKHSYIIKAAVKFYEEHPDDYEDTLIQTIYNFFSDELGEDWTTKVSTPSSEDEKDYAYGWTDEKDEAFYNVLTAFLTKNNLNVSEATFTDKHDDNPKLKGGQKDLPDEVQAGILKKEGEDDDSGGGTLKIEKKDNKYYWTWITKSGKSQKSNDGFESKAEAQRDFMRKSKYMKESEGQDHEVFMAQNSLKAIISAASQLMNKVGDNERDIPGWIQDHITNAENYIEQANQGFHELEPAVNDMNMDTIDMVAEEVSANKKNKARSALLIHLQAAREEGDGEAEKEVLAAREEIMRAKTVEELASILDEFGFDTDEISDILGK